MMSILLRIIRAASINIMTEIRFYHLERQTQNQVIPVILTKALDRGHRVIMKMSDSAEVLQMNEHLWSFSAGSFLPHGCEGNGRADLQPIWITHSDENPNEADVIILSQGAEIENPSKFNLCCEMLDGHDESAVLSARARWKKYKEQDFDLTYWQQNENGTWEKKA